ncbi:MAG: hypothetical protein ACK5JF_01825 [Oscillospiraceae bacterium]
MKNLAFLCITLLLCVGLLAACDNTAPAVSSSAPQPVADEEKTAITDTILNDTSQDEKITLMLQYDELAEKLKDSNLTPEERELIEQQLELIKENIQ